MLSTYWLYVAVIILILWIWYARRRLPPGPWGLPIVGYLPWLNPKAPHLTLTELSKRYGPIYGLSLGSVYTVVLSDHKLVRNVFAKSSTTGRAPLYLTHGIMKGYGLICSEGELWKDQRKFATTAFRQIGATKLSARRNAIEILIMSEVTDLLTYIRTYPNNSNGVKTLNLSDSLKHNIGSLINKIVFGKSYARDDELWKWLLDLQEEGTKYIGVAGPLNFLPFLRHLPYYKKIIKYILHGKDETHELYLKIINEEAEKLRRLRENNKDHEPENILQAFLMEKEKRIGDVTEKFYDNAQFLHLLADMFGAGLDTTSATLRWFFLYIAHHSDIQTKIQKEIDSVIRNRKPSFSDFNDMHYTQAALAEIQRIQSVVPIGIPHGAMHDIEIDGYTVPQGTMIVPLQWAIHTSSDIWKNPEEFNPARFLTDEGRFVWHEALIPFQTGKRMCIGTDLSKIILFLFVTSLLQEFRISPSDEGPLDATGDTGITLTPKEYVLVLQSRT